MKKMSLQFFADARTGVNPTNEILFGVCTTGRPVDLKSADYTTVKDAESLSVSIDGSMESWNPMDAGGLGKKFNDGEVTYNLNGR